MARVLKQDVLKQFKSVFYCFKTFFICFKTLIGMISQKGHVSKIILINMYVFLFSNQPLIFIANLYYIINCKKHKHTRYYAIL